jgi:hypothetical protein
MTFPFGRLVAYFTGLTIRAATEAERDEALSVRSVRRNRYGREQKGEHDIIIVDGVTCYVAMG